MSNQLFEVANTAVKNAENPVKLTFRNVNYEVEIQRDGKSQ